MSTPYWTIPRRDKKRRCGRCLRVFKPGEIEHRDRGLYGYRFPTVGECCYIPGEPKKNKWQLNEYGK